MISLFKIGDTITYGVIDAIFLGAFGNERAFIMSEVPRDSFRTGNELCQDLGTPHLNLFLHFVREHFDYPFNLNSVLDQRRFATVLLANCKKDQRWYYKSLLSKRRMHIKMAYFYMRTNRRSEDIARVCNRIDSVQLEIDSIEEKARKHLS